VPVIVQRNILPAGFIEGAGLEIVSQQARGENTLSLKGLSFVGLQGVAGGLGASFLAGKAARNIPAISDDVFKATVSQQAALRTGDVFDVLETPANILSSPVTSRARQPLILSSETKEREKYKVSLLM